MSAGGTGGRRGRGTGAGTSTLQRADTIRERSIRAAVSGRALGDAGIEVAAGLAGAGDGGAGVVGVALDLVRVAVAVCEDEAVGVGAREGGLGSRAGGLAVALQVVLAGAPAIFRLAACAALSGGGAAFAGARAAASVEGTEAGEAGVLSRVYQFLVPSLLKGLIMLTAPQLPLGLGYSPEAKAGMAPAKKRNDLITAQILSDDPNGNDETGRFCMKNSNATG